MPDVFQTLTTETTIAILIILGLVVALIVNMRRKRRNDYKMNANGMTQKKFLGGFCYSSVADLL